MLGRRQAALEIVARGLGVVGLVGGTAGVPDAATNRGSRAPRDARVADVVDRALTVRDLGGAPALVMYETRETSSQNAPVKAELKRIVGAEPALGKVRIVAVADVSAYDFWPARGAVKDAIRDEQKRSNVTIWLDWSGAFREKLALDEGTSNVVLLDASGTCAFAKSGALGTDERKALYEAMRSLTKS